MNPTPRRAGRVALGGAVLLMHGSYGQETVQRSDLLRHELDATGREVLQVRVDLPAGTHFGRHWHPGVEVAHVLEGTIEYRIDGEPPVTLRAGQALFIPAEAIHSARNVGTGRAAELATYIVESGRPLLTSAE